MIQFIKLEFFGFHFKQTNKKEVTLYSLYMRRTKILFFFKKEQKNKHERRRIKNQIRARTPASRKTGTIIIIENENQHQQQYRISIQVNVTHTHHTTKTHYIIRIARIPSLLFWISNILSKKKKEYNKGRMILCIWMDECSFWNGRKRVAGWAIRCKNSSRKIGINQSSGGGGDGYSHYSFYSFFFIEMISLTSPSLNQPNFPPPEIKIRKEILHQFLFFLQRNHEKKCNGCAEIKVIESMNGREFFFQFSSFLYFSLANFLQFLSLPVSPHRCLCVIWLVWFRLLFFAYFFQHRNTDEVI